MKRNRTFLYLAIAIPALPLAVILILSLVGRSVVAEQKEALRTQGRAVEAHVSSTWVSPGNPPFGELLTWLDKMEGTAYCANVDLQLEGRSARACVCTNDETFPERVHAGDTIPLVYLPESVQLPPTAPSGSLAEAPMVEGLELEEWVVAE